MEDVDIPTTQSVAAIHTPLPEAIEMVFLIIRLAAACNIMY